MFVCRTCSQHLPRPTEHCPHCSSAIGKNTRFVAAAVLLGLGGACSSSSPSIVAPETLQWPEQVTEDYDDFPGGSNQPLYGVSEMPPKSTTPNPKSTNPGELEEEDDPLQDEDGWRA